MTPEKFQEWLEGFPEGTVVGLRWSPFDCPLARWQKETGNGSSAVLVLALAEALPAWAHRFVGLVDGDGPPNEAVTAWEAMDYLTKAVR